MQDRHRDQINFHVNRLLQQMRECLLEDINSLLYVVDFIFVTEHIQIDVSPSAAFFNYPSP